MQIKYIARVWIDSGDIIFFFPDAPVNFGRIMSWMHIGQHSEASPDIMRRPHTRPATDAECVELVAEYERYYNCRLSRMKRLNYNILRRNWV